MRYVIATAVIGLTLGLVLRHLGGGQPVGFTMVAIMVVLPLIGVLVTIDDDLPGGFSNPDGKQRGPWREWESWADIGARAAITGIGFAIDIGWNTLAAVVPWVIGAAGLVASVLVQRRISKVVAHGG
jgi:hypothetical protein